MRIQGAGSPVWCNSCNYSVYFPIWAINALFLVDFMKKTILIGTGNIAAAHGEALALTPGVTIAGVLDQNQGRAESFARKHNIPQIYPSLESVCASQAIDCAHVLTPPPFHHSVAIPLLQAGISLLSEKPLADNPDHAMAMVAAARKSKTPLRTNQNFIFHPAHLRLKKEIAANRIGPLRRGQARYVMPLRQLAARQFGHWMFASPLNLLLEQAIHPLSQLDDLFGPLTLAYVKASVPQEVANAIALVTQWDIGFSSPSGPVHIQMALGESFHDWSLDVLGDDGCLKADYLANRVSCARPGAYLDVMEDLRSAMAQGFDMMGQSLVETGRYFAAQARVIKRADPFFRSIRASVEDFYQALGANERAGSGHDLDGARGARLVALCQDIADATPSVKRPKPPRSWQPGKEVDCVVLGGTGFIGQALVRRLVSAEKNVRVIARNVDNLSEDFVHPLVEVAQGSASDTAFLKQAFDKVPVVINLAHGGGGETYEQIKQAMMDAAMNVAEAVKATGVQKLLHVSSIAALYLGDEEKIITHETRADEKADERADYARAKAACERALMAAWGSEKLPVSLFRPGVVVGAGTSPFHSGVGLYNRERYCLGWNGGKNPLPFILVDDVADALLNAAFRVPMGKLNGECFNLVGDVRLTASAYTALLANETGRPLKFRGQNIWLQQAGEVSKWLVKKIGGRDAPFPSMRDLRSRGMVSPFDTAFEKKVLKWTPVADYERFVDKAIRVHVK